MTEQSIVERFLTSDEGKRIAEEQKKEILKERREAVEAINQLKADAELTIPKLRKENDTSLEMVKAAGKKLEAAQMRQGLAYQKLQSASHSFSVQTSKHEVFLRETYDLSLDLFLKEMNSLIVHVRETGPQRLKSEQVRGRSSFLRYEETFDKAGHEKTIAKIAEIYESAQAMKMEDHADVSGELAKLRESIPINLYTSGFNYISY